MIQVLAGSGGGRMELFDCTDQIINQLIGTFCSPGGWPNLTVDSNDIHPRSDFTRLHVYNPLFIIIKVTRYIISKQENETILKVSNSMQR
jgi:hypothetical protein